MSLNDISIANPADPPQTQTPTQIATGKFIKHQKEIVEENERRLKAIYRDTRDVGMAAILASLSPQQLAMASSSNIAIQLHRGLLGTRDSPHDVATVATRLQEMLAAINPLLVEWGADPDTARFEDVQLPNAPDPIVNPAPIEEVI